MWWGFVKMISRLRRSLPRFLPSFPPDCPSRRSPRLCEITPRKWKSMILRKSPYPGARTGIKCLRLPVTKRQSVQEVRVLNLMPVWGQEATVHFFTTIIICSPKNAPFFPGAWPASLQRPRAKTWLMIKMRLATVSLSSLHRSNKVKSPFSILELLLVGNDSCFHKSFSWWQLAVQRLVIIQAFRFM